MKLNIRNLYQVNYQVNKEPTETIKRNHKVTDEVKWRSQKYDKKMSCQFGRWNS